VAGAGGVWLEQEACCLVGEDLLLSFQGPTGAFCSRPSCSSELRTMLTVTSPGWLWKMHWPDAGDSGKTLTRETEKEDRDRRCNFVQSIYFVSTDSSGLPTRWYSLEQARAPNACAERAVRRGAAARRAPSLNSRPLLIPPLVSSSPHRSGCYTAGQGRRASAHPLPLIRPLIEISFPLKFRPPFTPPRITAAQRGGVGVLRAPGGPRPAPAAPAPLVAISRVLCCHCGSTKRI
jgi:hypothetical protein